MLMRSLSPLLALPNTCDASRFVSQCFPCGWQQHWSTAAFLGFTAVLALLLPLLPAHSVPACSLGPCGTVRGCTGCGCGAAMSSDLAQEVPLDTAPFWLAIQILQLSWCMDGTTHCKAEPPGAEKTHHHPPGISPALQHALPQCRGVFVRPLTKGIEGLCYSASSPITLLLPFSSQEPSQRNSPWGSFIWSRACHHAL